MKIQGDRMVDYVKKTIVLIVAFLVLLNLMLVSTHAEVTWRIDKTFPLDQAPIDTAASTSGKWVFVLSQTGNLHIFKADGTLRDTITVGKHVDGIRTGAEDHQLYLQSRANKSVEMLTIDFIHDFDLTGSPIKGSPDAPVTIVEFSDFECAYCSRLVGLMDQVLKKNPDDVRLVFKHFPLSSHKFAVKAALASMVANETGQFWAYHDELFKNYNALNEDKIKEITQNLGFDPEAFDKKTKNPALLEQIKKDYRQGIDAGVRGTPTVFINGQIVRDRSLKGIQAMIDAVLEKNKK